MKVLVCGVNFWTYNSPLAKILLAFSSETKCALTWKATLWMSNLSPTRWRSVPTNLLSFIKTWGGCFSITRPLSTREPKNETYDDFILGRGFWPSRIGMCWPENFLCLWLKKALLEAVKFLLDRFSGRSCLYSQVSDVPESAHRGFLAQNIPFIKTGMNTLTVFLYHDVTQNNFIKIFGKTINFMVSTYLGIFATTHTNTFLHIWGCRKVKRTLRFKFNKSCTSKWFRELFPLTL